MEKNHSSPQSVFLEPCEQQQPVFPRNIRQKKWEGKLNQTVYKELTHTGRYLNAQSQTYPNLYSIPNVDSQTELLSTRYNNNLTTSISETNKQRPTHLETGHKMDWTKEVANITQSSNNTIQINWIGLQSDNKTTRLPSLQYRVSHNKTDSYSLHQYHWA